MVWPKQEAFDGSARSALAKQSGFQDGDVVAEDIYFGREKIREFAKHVVGCFPSGPNMDKQAGFVSPAGRELSDALRR